VVKELDKGPHKWLCKTKSIVSLVVDPNHLRARGNSSAHEYAVEEIREAVESLGEGVTRTMFLELCEYVSPELG
jgi:hypothetical protein